MALEDLKQHQFSKENHERAVELGRRGGLKSVEVRRKKKDMKEDLALLYSLGMKSGKITPAEKLKSLNPDAVKKANLNMQDLSLIALINKAIKGQPDAIKLIREILGEDQPQPSGISSLDGLAAEIARYREEDDDTDEGGEYDGDGDDTAD